MASTGPFQAPGNVCLPDIDVVKLAWYAAHANKSQNHKRWYDIKLIYRKRMGLLTRVGHVKAGMRSEHLGTSENV